MKLRGMERVLQQKEQRELERQKKREVVDECRNGNFSRFKYISESDLHRLGISEEEFNSWSKQSKLLG